jgi:hypothetical protein
LIAPLPLRFFALGEDEVLTAYVAKLNADEQEKCREIYAGGAGDERTASTGGDPPSPSSLPGEKTLE